MIHQSGIHIKNGEIITIQRSVSPRVHTLFEVSFSSIRIIYPYYCSPNTVSRFEGKLYVIIIFISNMLVLLSGEMPDTGWDSLPQVVKALVLSFIWFSYLCVSRQVENLFPK